MAALKGADIILSPVGFVGENNRALQVSGMWQEVQQNQFFAGINDSRPIGNDQEEKWIFSEKQWTTKFNNC